MITPIKPIDFKEVRMVRTIKYQAMDGKWYEKEVSDLVDPLDKNQVDIDWVNDLSLEYIADDVKHKKFMDTLQKDKAP